MADVFISYAREDREHAARLAAALEARGFTVWWDRQIPVGKSFDQVIEEAIHGASCVTVLWSKASVASRWVRNEAALAQSREVLLPVLIEDVTPPLAFIDIQAVRIDTTKELAQTDFELLIDAMKNALGRRSGAIPALTKPADSPGNSVVSALVPPSAGASAATPKPQRRLLQLLKVQVVASWASVTLPMGAVLTGIANDGILGNVVGVAIWACMIVVLAAGVWLGALGLSYRLARLVVQGWGMPLLGLGMQLFAILLAAAGSSRWSAQFVLSILVGLSWPVVVSIGASKTAAAIRAKGSAPLTRGVKAPAVELSQHTRETVRQ